MVLADLEGYQEVVDEFDKWLKLVEKSLESFKTLPLSSKELSPVYAKFEVLYLESILPLGKKLAAIIFNLLMFE